MICAHMFQRVDGLNRFWCIDCGEFQGIGDYVKIDEPLTRQQVENMRTEFETRQDADQD